MIRREFIRLASLAGVTTLGAAAAAERLETGMATSTVEWRVKGFSCITCATGFEVTLERQKGVVRVHATYPEGRVAIRFHTQMVDEATLKAFIEEMGFSVETQG